MVKIQSSKDFRLVREVEYGTPEQNKAVKEIVSDIKKEGDSALLRYTERFDGATLRPEQLRVTPEELQAAYGRVEESFVSAIRAAAVNIRVFHARQKRNS